MARGATRWAAPLLAALLAAGAATYLWAGKGEPGGGTAVRQTLEVREGGREAALVVEHAGSAPLRLRFRTAQQFEARALADGREVWRWSAERVFAQVVTDVELAPGERRTWTFTLPELPPGTYALEAWLVAEGLDLPPARAELVIR